MRYRKRAMLLMAGLACTAAAGASPEPGVRTTLHPPAKTASAAFDRDRTSILGMAGDYDVRFDMRETVSFVAGYELLPPKTSGGHEIVRVVEDTGTVIRLQHLLIVERGGGQPFIVKHWRQDWTYEPSAVLTYASAGRWTLTPVAAEARRGAWSQTVWQTDDSPRYGGVGRWQYVDGVARWTSEATRRPLARRDAIRHPPYAAYIGTNRHALTPDGWVHEQDNAKVGPRDGASVTFAHEQVVNTYRRSSAFAVAAGETYWAKTKDYWAKVRTLWSESIARQRGIVVEEEAETGSVTAPRLMEMADEIAAGTLAVDAAVSEAARSIAAPRAAVNPSAR